MIQLLKQIKWQFLIFQKNNLITMIIGITVFYVLLIYAIKDFANVEKFITLLIYNDPAIVGFIFIGMSMILEKDQNVLPALFVTPLKLHLYLTSRIITLSAIGFFGALAMVVAARGTSFNPIFFSSGHSQLALYFVYWAFLWSATRPRSCTFCFEPFRS